MIIRKAENRDINALLRLLLQVGMVHHHIRPELFQPEKTKYDAAALEALLQDESKIVFVAENGGEVLGYCFCNHICHSGKDIPTARKEIYIDDLCVDENMRGQGIATALFEHVRAWAKENGCNYITLNVWCGNESAMAFYEKMGMTARSITMETKLC